MPINFNTYSEIKTTNRYKKITAKTIHLAISIFKLVLLERLVFCLRSIMDDMYIK